MGEQPRADDPVVGLALARGYAELDYKYDQGWYPRPPGYEDEYRACYSQLANPQQGLAGLSTQPESEIQASRDKHYNAQDHARFMWSGTS